MLSAKYPGIDDPHTTVGFMIAGLRAAAECEDLRVQMLFKKPKDPKDFVQKYNKCVNFKRRRAGSSSTLPSENTTTTAAIHEILMAVCQERRFLRSAFKPCRHHISPGVPHSRHSEKQYRAPNHPRHKKPKATANEATIDYSKLAAEPCHLIEHM